MTIYTLRDAREYQDRREAVAMARDERAAERTKAAKERVAAILKAWPQIGTLQKASGVWYYLGTGQRQARDPAELVQWCACPECGTKGLDDNGCGAADLDYTVCCTNCGYQYSPNI